MKAPCTCKLLSRYSRDPLVQVVERGGEFVLGDGTNPDPRLTIQYCPFCGEFGWPDRGKRRCDCGVMESIVRDFPSLMEFDSQMNEFHFLSPKGSATYQIYYCISCGGNPPKSRRSDFFEEASEEELNRAWEQMQPLENEADFEREFGPPVKTFECPPLPRQLVEIYDMPDVAKQWDYVIAGAKVTFCLQRLRNGTYLKSLSTRPKPQP